MNRQNSSGSLALKVWLTALFLFLSGLGWLVFSVSSTERQRVTEAPAGTPAETPAEAMAENTSFVTVLDLTAPGDEKAPAPVPDATTSTEYVLAGAGLQGFYQNSAPDDVWTLSYPEPQMQAQLIRRGPPSPQIVTDGVRVTWELEPKAGLAPGAMRQGRMEPPNVAQDESHFKVAIPVRAGKGNDVSDLYPVVRLRAEDEKSGKTLAESAAVLATAPGFGCAHCHENAGTAILEVHDRHQGTDFLARHARGEVVACRSCHDGLSAEPDGKQKAGKGLGVSAAVHGWHAAYMGGQGADACMTCHVAEGRLARGASGDSSGDSFGEKVEGAELLPLFARDFHGDKGMDCVRCHGFLEDHALALLKAEREAGQELAVPAMNAITAREMPVAEMNGRLPWVQQPDCTSCHDFVKKPDPRTASAFNRWTDAKEGAAALFSRRRDDMLMVRCIACHGAPHALYAARNPFVEGRDNIPPIQYQHRAAPLGSGGACGICHGQPMDFSAHHPLVE